ncbi:MAG: universal stress protein [Thermomicrobiales bacterium]|nr:universal stress protein [Thermomicrobiales bacterium]MCO5222085.1 universal stress protein [Thermomicrobiales bacterium]
MAKRNRSELIVVPLDGSEQAEQVIPYAEGLRNKNGTLLFFQVVNPSGPARGLFGDIEVTMEGVIEQEREAARARLIEIADRWDPVLRKKPEVEAYAGDAVDAIKAIVAEKDADMLAIASSGRGALSRWAFGSVADTLMRDAPAPVLIVHPTPESEGEIREAVFTRIIVPLDGSETAEAALPEAARLSQNAGLPVALVQVVNPSLEFSMVGQGLAPITADLYNEVEADFINQANEALDRGVAALGDLDADIVKVVLEGGTTEAIKHYVEPGDLIVMTSHGRTGFRRFLLGSVAQKIINDRIAPVVLVPAAGEELGASS